MNPPGFPDLPPAPLSIGAVGPDADQGKAAVAALQANRIA